ncbi:MAG: HAMP domain-containing histidine kinase [Lachnospiraceae bacterium]|nr:HAMP domain-containing histidine kinase [Lachnospiraceae bacterium]
MLAWKVAAVVSVVLFTLLLVYLWRIKRELRNIQKELEATRDKSYNRQISVDLLDKDLLGMTTQLNKNLDYQKQLKLETEKAEKSIRKSVSDIAHDLRTPLTVMKGNLQMLNIEEALSDKGKQYVEVCMNKADEMREMADDFFQLSLLESDLEDVELRRVDITESLLQFLVAQEAVIRTKGMEPEVIFPQKSVFVLADGNLLDRMFGNLLNNVLRHAKGNTFQIRLEDSKEDKECTITFANVVDAPQTLQVDALFNRTYRGEKARTGSGAGLGLYIVKLLAQKQKARANARLKENRLEISVVFPLSK